MDKVKSFIKDNIVLVIVFILVVGIFIGFLIYQHYTSSIAYEKNVTDMVDVDYIKKNYEVNEYQNVTVEYVDVLDEYHSYFISKMINDPEGAYEMLTDECKKQYNEDIEEFKKYINDNVTVAYRTSMVSEYRTNGTKNVIEIVDTDNNKFTIYEDAVWDIKISIDGKR